MPLVCTTCNSPDRKAIDQAIVAGESFRTIAERYGVHHTSIFRHKQNCLGPLLLKAEKKLERHSMSLTDRLDTIWDIALGTIQEARAANERQPIAGLMHQAHKNIEIRGQLTGELGQNHQPASQINLLFQLPRASEAPRIASQVVDAAPVAELAAGDEPDEQ